jgi:CotS family spore coat protein
MGAVLPPVPAFAAKEYGLKVKAWQNAQRIWRLETDRGVFALKCAPPGPEAEFLRKAEAYLRANGFNRFPPWRPTRTGAAECLLPGGERYILRPWLAGMPPGLDAAHPAHLRATARAVAEMHLAGEGFRAVERATRDAWPMILRERLEDLSRLRGQKTRDSRFARLYQSMIPDAIKEGGDALFLLKEADYYGLAAAGGGLCHGDLAANNMLVRGGDVHLLDFDRAEAHVFPYDLAMLLRRVLAALEWRPEPALILLAEYNRARKLPQREMRVLTAFLHWPQPFWRLGHQYFTERLDRPERYFLGRLWHWRHELAARMSFLAYCRENF